MNQTNSISTTNRKWFAHQTKLAYQKPESSNKKPHPHARISTAFPTIFLSLHLYLSNIHPQVSQSLVFLSHTHPKKKTTYYCYWGWLLILVNNFIFHSWHWFFFFLFFVLDFVSVKDINLNYPILILPLYIFIKKKNRESGIVSNNLKIKIERSEINVLVIGEELLFLFLNYNDVLMLLRVIFIVVFIMQLPLPMRRPQRKADTAAAAATTTTQVESIGWRLERQLCWRHVKHQTILSPLRISAFQFHFQW